MLGIDSEFEYSIKLLLVGDSSVGKSNFIYRYIEDKFNPIVMATPGLDLKTTDVEIEGKKIRIQLWDTAGQEKYKSITKNLFLKVQGIIAVYDISKEESFTSLKGWIKSIKEEVGKETPILMVGNKSDLEDERIIAKDEAIEYAKQEKLEYIETSSKTGENVKIAINNICKKILENKNYAKDSSFFLDSTVLSKKEKKKCCGGGEKDE